MAKPIIWEKRHGEVVTTVADHEVAVRTAIKMFTAHFGPDRWIIGGFNSRYRTANRAKAVAITYARSAPSLIETEQGNDDG